MTPSPPLEVVVLDDVSRFAAHVWQYLSGNIGFGIGDMSTDGGDGQSGLTIKENVPIQTPAGEVVVRWLNIGLRGWESRLGSLLKTLEGKQAYFLVDVRGPVRPGLVDYRWKAAIEVLLKGHRKEEEILPVSAYHTGILNQKVEIDGLPGEKSFGIQQKTWKVLQKIAKNLPAKSEPLFGIQILVTGAGFELAENQGGCYGLGMLSTDDLLRKAWQTCGYVKDFEEQGFPVPQRLLEGLGGESDLLREAAHRRELDEYWNEALKLVLSNGLRAGQNSRERKVNASQEEYRAREAFRRELLGHDWGHLNQALDAVSLGWLAWLSTNYTGFADRALALQALHDPPSREQRWSIVSTSNEALYLIRELLHGDHRNPILFKLHGHVEHLMTMAMAGQDKEIYSTLSLPIDSLHNVYHAAELYLRRRLNNEIGNQKDPVLWHIVGHGLKDTLLVELLIRACESTPHADHKFIFVKPDAERSAHEDRGHFSKLNLDAGSFFSVPLGAREYMARLRTFGLSAGDHRDLNGWIDRLYPATTTTPP